LSDGGQKRRHSEFCGRRSILTTRKSECPLKFPPPHNDPTRTPYRSRTSLAQVRRRSTRLANSGTGGACDSVSSFTLPSSRSMRMRTPPALLSGGRGPTATVAIARSSTDRTPASSADISTSYRRGTPTNPPLSIRTIRTLPPPSGTLNRHAPKAYRLRTQPPSTPFAPPAARCSLIRTGPQLKLPSR